MGLPQSLRGNVTIAYYEAGHMMYIRKADHAKLKKDVQAFIRGALSRRPVAFSEVSAGARVAAKPPPSYVFEQVALTAAEESGDYF